MKTKCRALWSSLVILAVSLFITFFWQLHCPYSLDSSLYNYGYTLLVGIVSSSFVTTLIYVVEYFSAKKQSLENYAQEVLLIMNKMRKIKLFKTEEPISIVTQYFTEQEHNKRAMFQRNQVFITGQTINLEDEPFCVSTTALKNWQMYLLERQGLSDFALEPGVLDAENNIIDKDASKYENQIKVILQDYEELSTITFDKADMLLEDIQFFSDGWKSRRRKNKLLRPRKWDNIYFHVHKPIRTMLYGENTSDNCALLSVCRFLNDYNYGEQSLSTVILKIDDWQNREFVYNDINTKKQTKHSGFYKFCDVITLQIGKYLLKNFDKEPFA